MVITPEQVRKPPGRSRGNPGDRWRLIVVANRLPVHQEQQGRRKSSKRSPGGLVSAVTPFVEQHGGAWVGWPGFPDGNVSPFSHEGIRILPVTLSEHELDCFYYGFSNTTLWPLYHDGIRPPVFRRRWWRQYVEVNRHYADATAQIVKPGDLIWIHDYQLQLVPALLRERCPENPIGFFLHIPFPPEEIFARLPWRSQILEGLLGSDIIGFQTKLGAQNFSRSARRFTSAKGTDSELTFGGRAIRIAPFPISIDLDRYQSLAQSPAVIRRAKELQEQFGKGRQILLGVDRLDYTKGIDIRLRAIDEMFGRGRVGVDDCVFVQIAVPSRENVDEYARMRRTVEGHVGRINGEFSDPARPAVHYLRRSLPVEELVAFYLAAAVMTVTPLRDGMNLVAKEYVATRTENRGVLVLSEFAGAAHELRAALLVNPYDIDGMASAFESALHLSNTDIGRRMSALRRALAKNTVFDWAESFIRELKKIKVN
jgi:trehalose 6-phosphate synthase